MRARSTITAAGFPGGGQWNEVFNSDVYDQWFTASAGITLPAKSLIVFARDGGDL
jgi:hypothetical protein